MSIDPGQMVPQNHPLETPASVAVPLPPATGTGPVPRPEPALVEGDLCLIGVGWFRVGLAADGRRLVLERPLNHGPEGGLW